MNRSRSNRIVEWAYGRGRALFVSLDFALGAMAAVAVYVLAVSNPATMNSHRGQIVTASIAIGLTVLGTTTALMTNFVSMLHGGRYRFIVRRAAGGVEAALWPYKIIASLAAILVLIGVALLLVWEIENPLGISATRARAGGVAASAGAAVWSVIGVAQLVALNLFHALQKNRMEEVIDDLQRPSEGGQQSRGA